MGVRVRIPPSPTGNLHLGNAYTFLFNYLFAKKNKGVLTLRFEDTDRERSKKEFEENIMDGLKWLGIKWDEGPSKQSEGFDNCKKVAEEMVGNGKAYYCFCTPEELDQEKKGQQERKAPIVYSKKCRNLTTEEINQKKAEGKKTVIRFKMPEGRGKISWRDLIHDTVAFDSELIGDFVILRADLSPIYNFAVVVDDIGMEITHVLRGDDHLSNTPKQIVLFEALEAPLPEFAHWPNILNSDRSGKLSKREDATAVTDYRKDGYFSEALVNYLALLGWTMPEGREIMSLSEMEETFDLGKMRKSPAAFDLVKLDWLNGEYIRKLSDEELTERLEQFLVDHPTKEKLSKIVPLIKDRIKKLSDFIPLTDFLFEKPDYDLGELKTSKLFESDERVKEILGKIVDRLENLPSPWISENFEKSFRALAKELELPPGDIFQIIRIAVSGQHVTPPLFESIHILGEEETLSRIRFFAKNYPDFPDYSPDLKMETNLS